MSKSQRIHDEAPKASRGEVVVLYEAIDEIPIIETNLFNQNDGYSKASFHCKYWKLYVETIEECFKREFSETFFDIEIQNTDELKNWLYMMAEGALVVYPGVFQDLLRKAVDYVVNQKTQKYILSPKEMGGGIYSFGVVKNCSVRYYAHQMVGSYKTLVDFENAIDRRVNWLKLKNVADAFVYTHREELQVPFGFNLLDDHLCEYCDSHGIQVTSLNNEIVEACRREFSVL